MDKPHIDPSQIAELERQLEAEKERRIDEKIARGEAIRVPLERHPNGMLVAIVTGVPRGESKIVANDAPYRARKVAELRAAGETREIYFEEPAEDDIGVIVTGVPRAGRDDDG
jgi:hypothetical protein